MDGISKRRTRKIKLSINSTDKKMGTPEKAILKRTDQTDNGTPVMLNFRKKPKESLRMSKVMHNSAKQSQIIPFEQESEVSIEQQTEEYFEADNEEEETRSSLKAKLKPFKVFISFDQFFQSLVLHSIYTICFGPFSYLVFLPIKRMRNYLVSLGLYSISGITLALVLTWISFILSVLIRFGFKNLQVDDSQIYTLIHQTFTFLIVISGSSLVTHFWIVEMAKRSPVKAEFDDFRYSAKIWSIQSRSVITQEIRDCAARSDMDTNLLYLNFITPPKPSYFKQVEDFVPLIMEVGDQGQAKDNCRLLLPSNESEERVRAKHGLLRRRSSTRVHDSALQPTVSPKDQLQISVTSGYLESLASR